MSKLVVACSILLVFLAAAGSGYLWLRSEEALGRMEQTLLQLKTRADAADQQVLRLRRDLAAIQTSAGARAQTIAPIVASAVDGTAKPAPTDAPRIPDGPVLTAAMREVLVNIEQCAFAARTLRCSFNVTNQSPVEKKFILGIGGRASRFEQDSGGTSVFDDVGNDFLSIGGGVGNRTVANCDNYTSCELEKVLTPNVKTEGFIRFDAVDARATAVKLLRVKWSDGDAWVPMDFRNIAITKLR